MFAMFGKAGQRGGAFPVRIFLHVHRQLHFLNESSIILFNVDYAFNGVFLGMLKMTDATSEICKWSGNNAVK